jgi:hypothetical protein
MFFDMAPRHVAPAMRGLFLMRGMLVVVGLEMFGLVLGTPAIPGHDFLQC